MRQAARELRLRGKVKYLTGAEYALEPDDIVSARISEGVDTGIVPGAVISAECTLVMNDSDGRWRTGGAKRGYAPLAGAEITLEIGVKAEDAWLYAPMGVYVCEDARAEMNSAVVELSCHDTIYFRTGEEFEDTLEYPCALKQVFIAAAEQAGYDYSGELPGGDLTVDAAPDWNGASVRRVLGYAAQIMGCCVLADRWGFLNVRPLAGERSAFVIYPAECLSRTVQEGHFGPVNALRVKTVNALGDGDSQQAELNFSIAGGVAENTVEVRDNPLFITGGASVNALGRAMLSNVAGLEYSRCAFKWRGDPDLTPGRYLKLVDPDGEETFCTISRQTLTFSGGFSADCICGTPEAGELSAGAVGWNGSVNAGSIVGVLSPGNIGAESITAAKLAAGAISADKIAAGAITAEKLESGSVTAEKISTGAVETGKLAAEAVTAEKLGAGSVTAEKIDAGAVETKHLAAGAVTAEKIAAGAVSAGHIAAKTITADSGIIADGAIGNAQIADGSITSAKVAELNADVITAGTLSAERLVIVGEDGIIYRLNAASSGLTLTELEADEYKNYINGTVIVAKSITAAQIAAQTITGNEILAGSVTAKEIDVSDLFAAEATINALNAMDITGNTYLKLMVTNAVDGLHIGGRNYAMNTGTAYTAESDGSERKWLFPWNCAGEALGKSLYGQTVTVSFDYDQDITSGTLTMLFNHTWGLVKSFAAGQAEGQRFEGTFELPVPETFAANQPAAVLYLDGTWDGSVTISNLKLETGDKATDWTPAPEDPASGVKTSYIEIADDHVDVSSGGNVNIQAGGSLNVDSAEFNVTTEDFQMSLAKADGEEVVMDIDEDGHTTFKAIHAGNVREAEYDYKLFTTESMGSLSALADYLKRTDARVVEYRMSADEYGSVKLGYYNGYVKIVANSHRLPQIYVDYTFSGTLWITDGYLSAPGTTVEDRCLEAHNGRVMLDNCWFTGEVAYGLYAAHMSEVRWSHTSTAEKQGYTLTAFLWARYGGAAYYRGYIPGGGIWPDTGWVQVSGTPTVVSGDGGSGSGESAASVTGTLGYYGTKNGWHASECFQGYSNAKGRAYACLTFDLSGVGTIQTAKLTLHRKSGAGLNRKCTVTVYGTTAARGSSPISGMTDAYTTATELVSWDANGTIDVTAAAKALKSGTIAQIVFYTGETGTYDSKAYSYHYAQFDSASMAVTYNG